MQGRANLLEGQVCKGCQWITMDQETSSTPIYSSSIAAWTKARGGTIKILEEVGHTQAWAILRLPIRTSKIRWDKPGIAPKITSDKLIITLFLLIRCRMVLCWVTTQMLISAKETQSQTTKTRETTRPPIKLTYTKSIWIICLKTTKIKMNKCQKFNRATWFQARRKPHSSSHTMAVNRMW